MAAKNLLGFFSTQPVHPVGADGKMELSDHFRELRGRLFRVMVALLIGFIVALFFYPQLLDLIVSPYNQAREKFGKEVVSRLTITGVGGPLLLQLKVCGIAALIGTSPIWLYQIFAFILPGLHKHEKKMLFIFGAVATPLFLLGVATGYFVMPTGLNALISLTPQGAEQLTDFDGFFSFLSRMLLVFGVAFEIPIFILALNLFGVLPGRTLGEYRPWIIISIFVFAAVATPSTDPFSMLLLAVPMTVLVLISEIIARILDRTRAKNKPSELSPDQASVI